MNRGLTYCSDFAECPRRDCKRQPTDARVDYGFVSWLPYGENCDYDFFNCIFYGERK